MSELAFNINGERFDLPASASFWRVRRFKASGRGTPEVVYGDDGLPLIIPIDSAIDEFRKVVHGVHGRYRLDPVDENHKGCEDSTAAYLQLSAEPSSAPSAEGATRSAGDDLLREIVQANSEMVKTIAEKFATVMDSAATLLRAADGAGMPSREPQVVPLQLASAWRNAEPVAVPDDDDGDDGPHGENQLARVLENVATTAMPLVTHHINTKIMGLTPEQSIAMMGAGAAGSAGTASSSAGAPAGKKQRATGDEQRADAAPAPDPNKQFFMHLAAIEQRLTPEESKLARRAIQGLPPEAMAAWRDQIMQMTPDEAAELVRAECQRINQNETAATSAGDTQTEKEAA